VLQCFQQGPVAGALAPVVILTDASNNRPISLLDRFGHSFVVLYFCTDADTGLSALREVATDLPYIPVALYLVVPKPPTTPATDSVCVLLDVEGQGASAYNAGPRTLYLVRPDRHIVARRFESDAGELLMLLRRAIGEVFPLSKS